MMKIRMLCNTLFYILTEDEKINKNLTSISAYQRVTIKMNINVNRITKVAKDIIITNLCNS